MKKIIFLFLVFSITFAFAQESGKYSVTNLKINTEYSDFGTAYYKNKQIVFASPKAKTLGSIIIKREWKPNKQRFLDLYTASIDIDGQLLNKKTLNEDVNTKWHEADVTFSKDFSTVYFTRDNYYANQLEKDSTGMTNLALFTASVNDDGTWTDVKPLPFNNKDYSVGHPAISNDGKQLYFVSDMPGSVGQTDIYVVDILGGNTFSNPTNLRTINTSSREMFPYVSDNGILYFSSDGRNSMGGLDIFATNLETINSTNPIHLNAPLNSPADDFAFIINPEKKTGYFSSNRTGGKGDDDIYFFTEETPIQFKCNQSFVAKVIDSETLEPIEGATLYVFHNGDMTDEVVVDNTGSFTKEFKCKDSFNFKAKMHGYTPTEVALESSERPEYTNQVAIKLIPIPIVKKGPKIYLGPIYFDLDKHNIRHSADADVELDRIVSVMQSYPDMIVAIESHTDSRASDTYNQTLSQNRAQTTKDYMIAKGIAGNRIVGISGLGESQLTNECDNTTKCSEEAHQMNRRTMFEITNPESYR